MLLSTCLLLNCDTQECLQPHMHTHTHRLTLAAKGNPCSHINNLKHTASPAMPLARVSLSLSLVKQILEKDLIVSRECNQTLRRQCVYPREKLHIKREHFHTPPY